MFWGQRYNNLLRLRTKSPIIFRFVAPVSQRAKRKFNANSCSLCLAQNIVLHSPCSFNLYSFQHRGRRDTETISIVRRGDRRGWCPGKLSHPDCLQRRKRGLQTGKRGLPAGKKVPSCSLRPPARMNKGGRPYNLERPPLHLGAAGRIRLSILCSCLSSRTPVITELLQLANVELLIKGISQQTPMARESQSSKRRLSGSRGC